MNVQDSEEVVASRLSLVSKALSELGAREGVGFADDKLWWFLGADAAVKVGAAHAIARLEKQREDLQKSLDHMRRGR